LRTHVTASNGNGGQVASSRTGPWAVGWHLLTIAYGLGLGFLVAHAGYIIPYVESATGPLSGPGWVGAMRGIGLWLTNAIALFGPLPGATAALWLAQPVRPHWTIAVTLSVIAAGGAWSMIWALGTGPVSAYLHEGCFVVCMSALGVCLSLSVSGTPLAALRRRESFAVWLGAAGATLASGAGVALLFAPSAGSDEGPIAVSAGLTTYVLTWYGLCLVSAESWGRTCGSSR